MNRQTYLAPGAHVVGDVTLGENVGIWYNAVVRGDTGSIFIDDNSNVQDNSTLHTDEDIPSISEKVCPSDTMR